ncbi:MAG: TSUP family transporter, partial [Bacteroidota bacterium]
FARLYLIHKLPDKIALGSLGIEKGTAILLIFAGLLLLSFGSMVFKALKPRATDEEKQEAAGDRNWPLLILLGLFIGTISSLVGSGGGVLVVPVMVLLLRLPIKVAAGTSLTMTAIKSLLGFLGDVYKLGDQLEWEYLISMALLMIGGIFLGTYGARFVSSLHLRKAFAGLLLCMALFILGQELHVFW